MPWYLTLILVLVISTTNKANAATAADLTADLRLLIAQSDSSAGKTDFSDATIRQALNLSQQAIAPLVGGVEWDTTIAMVLNRRTYTLGSNVMGIEGVWHKNDQVLNRIEYRKGRDFGLGKDSLQTKTTNQVVIFSFKFHRGKLSLFPLLASVSPKDSLLVDLYRYPTRFTADTTTFELPEYTRLAVVKLAEYLLRNNDFSIGEESQAMTNIGSLAEMFVNRFARRGYGGQE